MNSLLKQYINKIDINNINDFAIKNNIYLSKKELNTLYDVIKNRFDEILEDDSSVRDFLLKNLSAENYTKVINLYEEYLIKFKDYLL